MKQPPAKKLLYQSIFQLLEEADKNLSKLLSHARGDIAKAREQYNRSIGELNEHINEMVSRLDGGPEDRESLEESINFHVERRDRAADLCEALRDRLLKPSGQDSSLPDKMSELLDQSSWLYSSEGEKIEILHKTYRSFCELESALRKYRALVSKVELNRRRQMFFNWCFDEDWHEDSPERGEVMEEIDRELNEVAAELGFDFSS